MKKPNRKEVKKVEAITISDVGEVVEIPTVKYVKIRCPRCRSGDTYARQKTKTHRCRVCDHTWPIKK